MDTLGSQIVPDVHAYLIEGWWHAVTRLLKEQLAEAFGTKDIHILEFSADTLGIDTIRNVVDLQMRVSHDIPDVFILGCRTMTREAQNAFLKAIEEPTPGTYFFVVVPFARVLLPTLRSRLYVLERERVTENNNELLDTFLSSAPDERLQALETVIKEKDTVAAHMFFDDLLKRLYEKGNAYEVLEEIMQARTFLAAQGASLKLLLEHIALVTPRS